MKAFLAVVLALFVVATVFAADPEPKKDLKGSEAVYYAAPYASPYAAYGYAGYPYASYAAYPAASYAAYPAAYQYYYR